MRSAFASVLAERIERRYIEDGYTLGWRLLYSPETAGHDSEPPTTHPGPRGNARALVRGAVRTTGTDPFGTLWRTG